MIVLETADSATMDPMRRTTYDTEPVGAVEIAARLKKVPGTIGQWQRRYKDADLPFPPSRWTVSGFPAWDWLEVKEWAELTGRWPVKASE